MPPAVTQITVGSFAIIAVVGYVQYSASLLYLAGLFVASWLFQFVLWNIYDAIIRPLFLSPLRHLPQPAGNHWLLGHVPVLMPDPLSRMREWASDITNNGFIRVLWFFNQERVLLTSPKALTEVLTTKCYAFKKPDHIAAVSRRILGYGLLLSEGNEHKIQRRNLMPAFAFRHIKDLYPTFWQKSREVVRAMTTQCQDTTEMEISSWASRATLDIIGVAGMGRDFGAIKDANLELVQTYMKLLRPPAGSPILALLGLVLPPWLLNKLPSKSNSEIDEATAIVRSVCRDLIRDKRIKIANKESLTDVDILSAALESGQFTDDQLVDHLMTFLAAGHETTATAMVWAVYILCCKPDMQDRLREEVRAKLPSTDEEIDINSLDIDRMSYLNAFCSEVLRYWSPVPMTTREAINNIVIQGQLIPAGTRVTISPWVTNMDRDLWGPDAHEFDPGRWLTKTENWAGGKMAAAGNATSNYAFMTFLHGPRSCIGQSFSRAEFACLLAAWVGRFRFTLANKELLDERNLEIKVGATAKPKDGLICQVTVVKGY